MDRFDLENPRIAEKDPESETDKIMQARGIVREAEFLAQLRTDGRRLRAMKYACEEAPGDPAPPLPRG